MMVLSLVLLCSGPCLAAKIEFPPLTGRVVDQAHVLGPQAVQQLTGELAAEAKTGQQVVVTVVASLQGQTIEDYGYKLGRFWGIGQKDKDTGAILLVAPKEHKVRIEVGYGLEGTLTDAKASDIINEIILPSFKAGDMQAGVVGGAEAMLRVLNGQNVQSSGIAQNQRSQPYDQPPLSEQIQRPGVMAGLIGNGFFLLLIIIFLFIRPRLLGWLPLGMMASQSWGGSGGFSSGGSSFSGGGGSFGGGGASGSW